MKLIYTEELSISPKDIDRIKDHPDSSESISTDRTRNNRANSNSSWTTESEDEDSAIQNRWIGTAKS